MKAIQITVDEQLLKDLDADEEVQRLGRSAVMRRAVFDYLRKRRRKKIADAYRRAYGGRCSAPGNSKRPAWPRPLSRSAEGLNAA